MDSSIKKALNILEGLEADYEVSILCKDKETKYTNIIKQALMPPTAEDVCKALSKWFGGDLVEYKPMEQVFIFFKGDRKGGYITKANTNYNTYAIIGCALPPHLITLIGRFYEGLK